MLNGKCSPNVGNWERKNEEDRSGDTCHKNNRVKKELNSKMDSLIEFTDSSRNRISLMESQNKTKKRELEEEYLFLKKIGDVCKLSCDYYLETNVSFHEACENFKILFRAFEESLVNVKKKTDEADVIADNLSKIEDKVNLQMRESNEACEKSKKELVLLQTDVHYMRNESANIVNRIKDIDYQINQHKEAFESFHILTHLNTERISVLQNDFMKMEEERQEVLRGIEDAAAAGVAARDGLVVQKMQLEEERESLLGKERELIQKKEKLAIRRSEAKSDNDRLKSQMQFMQNQLSSQENFLIVIKYGLDGSIRTRKELSSVLEGINMEIEDGEDLMEASRREELEERNKCHEMEDKVKKITSELEGCEMKLEVLSQEEKMMGEKVERERINGNQKLLNELVKEKKSIDDEIGSYQEEARKLILREGGKMEGLLSSTLDGVLANLPLATNELNTGDLGISNQRDNPLDAQSSASEAFLRVLQEAIDNAKERIKEEQNEVWRKEREVERINALTSELRSKVKIEEDKGTKLDNLLEEKKEQSTNLREKESKMEKKLSLMHDMMRKEKINYEEKRKEAKIMEEKILHNKEVEKEQLSLLEKEYNDKKDKLLNSSGEGFRMVSSVDKRKMKDDVDAYLAKTKVEFDLKKKEFEKAEREKYQEMNSQLDGELKRKDDLIAYYEELISRKEKMGVAPGGSGAAPHERVVGMGNTKRADSRSHRPGPSAERRKSSQRGGTGNGAPNTVNRTTNSVNSSIDNSIDHVNSGANGNVTGDTSGANGRKPLNASETYKFSYFDVTSPGEMRKSMNIPNRSVKSPHIARLLEKIKLRKECQTLVGTKKVPLNQVNSSESRRSRTIGGGSSNRVSTGKSGKGTSRNKPFLNRKAPKSNDSFDLFHHL
ncbi:conserved Plasmodium protein, unknown function [Plasmodium knowlesi strain H]|uniref:Uncharacterized protein n=3 Tax=Plasmodium knowlesi TaxID=5850 RepID=A0A5K1VKU3_PLAKH|nr:conserved Plasmodium protein, unknown function [Plasmodium knowlesi strain H]OTN68381.1 Uncharacterized protein PKNOH_S03319200 [Plasmodium knowlesi]CAA9987094.1 conserved Plasmodium protein, unknown function [Plasmodium knowlesi strain H]SBO23828.1 conserved Plasmodium protein, unknown function [Plasmodium knowlesi strain H]SBO25606.1 conserved Plasmodium protein, unknown function [Plasmodium knowlesi strain H]VVS76568.1 conserved Plasmodium protein, unknown function [Plasmodium knowlesi s|eukprot:XP_002261716.1 hypothetical protein, conserved in Plasmodium species [Plasmodium knowlesi strain H]